METNRAMTFAEAVKQAFSERCMTAQELAEASGVNAPYVSRLLSGKIKEPTWQKACAIIDALGLTLEEFRSMQVNKRQDL